MEQTLQGKMEMIAEFMGGKKQGDCFFFWKHPSQYITADNGTVQHVNDFFYNTRWDWQIPVWSKLMNTKHPSIGIVPSYEFGDLHKKYIARIVANDVAGGFDVVCAGVKLYNDCVTDYKAPEIKYVPYIVGEGTLEESEHRNLDFFNLMTGSPTTRIPESKL